MPRKQPADPAAVLDELRATVRDAHAAIRDLGNLLKEYRKAADNAAQAARDHVQAIVDKEMREFYEQVQKDMNRSAESLNQAVTAARDHICSSLMLGDLTLDKESGQAIIRFKENTKFDEHAEVEEV